jgi:hypothetical protein
MTDAQSAVLEAAINWLAAKEAALEEIDETREGDPIETERALDAAEVELTNAVYRLLGREPSLPKRV